MFGSSSSKRKTMTHPYIQLSCAIRTVMHSTPRSIIWARGVSTCPFYVTIRHSSLARPLTVASSSFLRQQRAIKVVGLFGKGPRTERGRWPRRERERKSKAHSVSGWCKAVSVMYGPSLWHMLKTFIYVQNVRMCIFVHATIAALFLVKSYRVRNSYVKYT